MASFEKARQAASECQRRISALTQHRDFIMSGRALRIEQMQSMMGMADECGLPANMTAAFDRLMADVTAIDAYLPDLDVQVAVAQRAWTLALRNYDEALRVKVEADKLAQERRAVKDHEKYLRSLANKPSSVAYEPGPRRSSQRWRDWQSSSVNPVMPIVPVTEVEDVATTPPILLSDELDRRSRTLMSWAPWHRRHRYSRRYEGFA